MMVVVTLVVAVLIIMMKIFILQVSIHLISSCYEYGMRVYHILIKKNYSPTANPDTAKALPAMPKRKVSAGLRKSQGLQK